MAESAEPSGRFDFFEDNDLGVQSEDGAEKKPWGKTGKSVGFPKMFRFWGKKSDSEEKKVLSELQGMGIRRYDYMVLHKATRGFSSTCLMGIGGSQVYKGTLEGQQEVAIKVMPMVQHSYARDSYMTEIKVSSEMRHRNVVQLLGWCHQAGYLALVFEFMPNGSLEDHLRGKKDLPCLPWKVRYWRIAAGLASALQYLQEGLKECVVHRDIKPSNILLDSDLNPKLADFGLATVASRRSELDFSTTYLRGTLGYADPQYCMTTGKFCMEATDIYSFGVVALQIASGRMAIGYDNDGERKYLPEWVEELHLKGRILEAVDPNLGNNFDEREAERLLLVGLWCTQWDAESRPSIKLIIQLLNFEVPMPPDFISKVGYGDPLELSQEMNDSDVLENHSSPARTEEEPDLFAPGVDIDATTKSTTDRDTFENNEADDQSSEPDRDSYFQDDGAAPASSPEHTMFDIGLPPDFGSSAGIESNRTDQDHHVLNAFVHSLHQMMQSEEHLPQFDDALQKIKTCTAALIMTVGPPLDDWNTLAQLVLKYLKERDEFFKSYGDDASLADTATMLSSLDEGMRRCSRTIKEDRRRLKDSEERRARAQQRCSSLEAELADARGVLSVIEDEIKTVEERIAENLSSLRKRRRHRAILKQHDHVLSEISSFNS